MFLPVETKRSEGMREADRESPQESVHCYSTYPVLDAEELIHVTSGTEGRERKMPALHQYMSMVWDDLESICTAGCRARPENNM